MMARFDSGNRGRKRERERQGAVGGLGLASPWRDAVGVIVEAHAQALRTSARFHDQHGPRDRSAINGKATVSSTTCAQQRRAPNRAINDVRVQREAQT